MYASILCKTTLKRWCEKWNRKDFGCFLLHLCVLVSVVLCSACSKVDKYPNTPEGIARKILDCSLERDIKKLQCCFPSEEEMKSVCALAVEQYD